MEIKDMRLIMFGLCGVYAGSAVAIEPASISVGAFDVIPQLTIQLGHDDNIFSQEAGETSSMITVINPSVQFVAENENDAYRVTADIKRGTYADSSADNYTDQNLTAEAILELNSRNRLSVTAGYAKLHENRGSTDTATGSSPSRYTDKTVAAVYRFGAESAQANVEIAASYLDHSYDNFANLNAGRDRDNARIGATFFYRVAPKTKALFEVRHEDIDYDLSTSTLDNTEQKYLVGATWDATAKTSGTAKIGYSNKKYDSSAKDDQDGVSWEVSARWAPLTYSTVDLMTSQEYEEASGDEDAVDTETISLTWGHAWNNRLSSQVMISHMTEDYVGDADNQENETDTLMLGLNYELQRWLSLNMAYTLTDKDSNLSGEGYDQNLFMLTLMGSL